MARPMGFHSFSSKDHNHDSECIPECKKRKNDNIHLCCFVWLYVTKDPLARYHKQDMAYLLSVACGEKERREGGSAKKKQIGYGKRGLELHGTDGGDDGRGMIFCFLQLFHTINEVVREFSLLSLSEMKLISLRSSLSPWLSWLTNYRGKHFERESALEPTRSLYATGLIWLTIHLSLLSLSALSLSLSLSAPSLSALCALCSLSRLLLALCSLCSLSLCFSTHTTPPLTPAPEAIHLWVTTYQCRCSKRSSQHRWELERERERRRCRGKGLEENRWKKWVAPRMEISWAWCLLPLLLVHDAPALRRRNPLIWQASGIDIHSWKYNQKKKKKNKHETENREMLLFVLAFDWLHRRVVWK